MFLGAFEGILKGYLKAVATGSTALVVGGSSIQKGEGNRNRGLVQIGPVGPGFRSFFGPVALNENFLEKGCVLSLNLFHTTALLQVKTKLIYCS